MTTRRSNENSSRGEEQELAPYQIHSDDTTTTHPASSYRGFSTSIAGSFQSLSNERVDTCSLVCCGILQNDRDRFIMTGIRPPNATRRVTTHVLVPLAILLMAMDCALHIPNPVVNQAVSTTLVLSLVLYFVWQCCKGRWKRERVRKELLYKKYRVLHDDGGSPRGSGEEENDDLVFNNPNYWMGQSRWDVRCAHAFLGCYGRDMVYNDTSTGGFTTASPPPPSPSSSSRPAYIPPNNLCGCLWNTFTMACCGACGCHVQVCGMCALAQEAREVEQMGFAPVLKMDYITFEPALLFAPKLWELRTSENSNLWTHLTTLSRLSQTIVKNCFIVAMVVLIAWSVVQRQLGHTLVALGAIVYAFIFLFLVHWPKHRWDVSVDVLIKSFASGFFLATTLAVSWELVLGMAIRVLMTVVMALSGVDVTNDPEYTLPAMGFAEMNYRDYLEAFGKANPVFYVIYLFVNAFCVAALIEEVCKYYGHRMVDHPDLWNQEELDRVVAAGLPQLAVEHEYDDESQEPESPTATPWPAMTTPLQAPKRTLNSIGTSITVTMVAVALGFACLEDLIYIFLYTKGGSLSDEISVMVIRSLLPIHPIVAAIQSIGVCRRDLEKDSKHQLGRIILPAVAIHGTFDFGLSFLDFVARNAAGGLMALIFAFSVMVAGILYYVKESRAQRQRLEDLDRASSVDQSSLL